MFRICGNVIEYVDQWPHLGHIFSSNGDDKSDIINRRNAMCGQINNVITYFVKREPFVKLKLLTSYCYSIYGSVLWDLEHPSVESICTTWRKAIRRSLGVPPDTSSKLLSIISNLLPIMDELARRTVMFINRCLSSDSFTVRSIANMSCFSLRMMSPMGRNAQFCCNRYKIPLEKINAINSNFIHNYVASQTDDDVLALASVLHELVDIKSNNLSLSSCEFNSYDIDTMINCCSHFGNFAPV